MIRTITIVSGVPRSGTSLMMRILFEAGLRVESDEGWSFELATAGTLTDDPRSKDWVYALPDRTIIKVLYPPILHMPSELAYNIIWMSRDPRECAKSLRKLGGRPRSYIHKATKNIEVINRTVPNQLRKGVKSLVEVDFGELLSDPMAAVAPIGAMLGVWIRPRCVARRSAKSSDLPLGTLETTSTRELAR